MATLTILDDAPYSGRRRQPRSLSALLLRYARLLADMTQTELAELTGLTVFSISRYESGDRTPSRTVRQLLASTLNVPELVLWDPEPVYDEQEAREKLGPILRRLAPMAARAGERTMLGQLRHRP